MEGGKRGLAFAFVTFLPEKTDEAIAKRTALFTWHDKSVNHDFQHISAVAPGGMILSPKTHTRTGKAELVCGRVGASKPFLKVPFVGLYVYLRKSVWLELACVPRFKI